MLQRPNVRLATIVGPGGIGKTRLALSVAEDSSAEFPDGVYFVNLAAITDPDHVLLAIGAAAGIPIEGDAIDALSSEFQDQQVLLVIDNFEHVAEGGSSVADLLGRSPGLKVLATSRVPLRIMSEYEYTLEPLGLPATGSDRPDSVSASDAVRLFIDRALAVIPGFSIDEENASPVASIVRIVDGLPLAIELAAARLRMLSPGALSERLTKSLDALGSGAADVPSRQRTLDAAIDWSYQLLTREEQTLFCRLCVFQGGFTVESAQEVAVEEGDAVDQLMVLVENSLILPAQGGEGRLRMLAPIREFGLRHLHEAGEYEWMKDRHADYYVRVAEGSLEDLRGTRQSAVVESFTADWNNMDVAAEWLMKKEDDASLVRMSFGMWVYLWIGNHLKDGARYLAAVGSPEDLDETLAGRYWYLRGGIQYEMGQYEDSKESIGRAVEILETNGDIDCHNWTDFVSALLLPVDGEDPAMVTERLEVSLARFRGFGDRWGEGYALIALGILAASNGDVETAEKYQVATRDLGFELGNGALIGLAEAQIGFTYISSGRLSEARDALRRSFDVFRGMNYREGLCYALEAAASLSFTEGQTELGMIALGAAEEVRERIGLHPWPLIMWLFDALSAMADSLDDPVLQAARHNGRQLNPFDAAALVLDASPVRGLILRLHRGQGSVGQGPPVGCPDLDLSLQGIHNGAGEVDLVQRAGASQPARAEDIGLHHLGPDDVEPNEKHAVFDELGSSQVDDMEHLLGDLHLLSLAPDMHVGADVVALVDPTEGGHFSVHLERLPVHHEETDITSLRIREEFLDHHIAVTGDGLDDLIHVLALLAGDDEHALATRAL